MSMEISQRGRRRRLSDRRGPDGHVALAQSVILQALRDGRIPGFFNEGEVKPNPKLTTDDSSRIARARHWLLSPNQTAFWCHVVDRSAYDLATNVQKRLNSIKGLNYAQDEDHPHC